MKEIFRAVPAEPCGQNHGDVDVGFLSCPCSLAKAKCYMIAWDGPGLGIVCENKEEGDRTAMLMNMAWHLSERETREDIIRNSDDVAQRERSNDGTAD